MWESLEVRNSPATVSVRKQCFRSLKYTLVTLYAKGWPKIAIITVHHNLSKRTKPQTQASPVLANYILRLSP